jgi:hypothetical protein
MPSIYIPPRKQGEYFDALRGCRFGSYEPLVEFILARTGATMMFFLSKTSIYHKVVNEDAHSYLSQMFSKEIADAFTASCNQARDSEDDP